jgi:hypothetical protein
VASCATRLLARQLGVPLELVLFDALYGFWPLG